MTSATRRTLGSLALPVAAATGVLAGSPLASADPQAGLVLDRTTVAAGDPVHVFAACEPGEGLNFVGSQAFVPTGQDGPYEGDGGVVPFTRQVNGGSEGTTTVRADISPGVYHVGERCGGGNAGGVELTVVAPR